MEDEGADLLHEAAWQVYAVPPEEFVSTRTAWVKRLRGEGHRDLAKTVGALRKPSVSAAAVNGLVRADEPVVQQLRDVGERLRHAQSALDAAGLAALRGERDDVLAAWVEAAQAHSPGGALTAAVEAEVRSTAVAALADAEATEVVLSGTLTRALSYSGFGEVDVADAVARTSTGVMLTRIEGGRAAPQAEDEVDEEDEDAGRSAEDDPEDGAEPEELAGGDDEAEPNDDGTLERLEEALDRAEADVSDARARRREALSAEKQTRVGVDEAQQAVEQARQLLEQAEHHLGVATRAHDQAAAELAEADTALTDARERRDTARETLEEAEDA